MADNELRARLTEALCQARRNLSIARVQQKVQYDRLHQDVHYEVDDLVVRRNHVLNDTSKQFAASVAKKWMGPYQVRENISSLLFKLADMKGKQTGGPVHVCDLKRYSV